MQYLNFGNGTEETFRQVAVLSFLLDPHFVEHYAGLSIPVLANRKQSSFYLGQSEEVIFHRLLQFITKYRKMI